MRMTAKSAFALVFAFFLMSGASFAYSVTAPTQTIATPTLSTKAIDMLVASDEYETINANILGQNAWVSLEQNRVDVVPGTASKVSLYVSPFVDTPLGLYKVTVVFESAKTGALKKADVYVYVEKGGVISVEKIAVIGSLQPLGSAKVEVYVKNYMTTTIQGVDVTAEVLSPSESIGVLRQTIPRLDPGREEKAEAVILFDKFAQPGTYTINAVVKYLNSTVAEKQTFVIEQKAIIQKAVEKTPLLFGSRKIIKLTNVGNKAGNETVTEQLSGADAVFFYGDEPSAREGGAYTWALEGIVPGESRYVQYSVDYTPVFVLIIAIIIAVWVYFTRIKTVRITKHILQKKEIEEGEEFTVALEVKNSMRNATDVEVNDFVPPIFVVKDSEGLKPARKKSAAGVELSWDLKDLKPREERVLTYKIAPIFGVHGTVKLPRASAIFESNRRKTERRSFARSIGLPERSADDWEQMFRIKRKKDAKKNTGSIF